MPVETHEVHEKVKVGDDFRYGCWNRPGKFNYTYQAPARIYADDGSFEVSSVEVRFANSHNCRYDLSLSDSACKGCTHRGSGEIYAEKIRSIGK